MKGGGALMNREEIMNQFFGGDVSFADDELSLFESLFDYTFDPSITKEVLGEGCPTIGEDFPPFPSDASFIERLKEEFEESTQRELKERKSLNSP